MRGVKVRTYIESYGAPYMQGCDFIITGGICYSQPFKALVSPFLDGDGGFHEKLSVELVEVSFYNDKRLTIPMDDFKRVVNMGVSCDKSNSGD